QRGIRAVDDQAAAGANAADQVVKLCLDGLQVSEDVGVVELQVVQDRDVRKIVDELAALVEKCGVVLVGLDHEWATVSEPGRDGEIERHSSDQETGRCASLL